MGRTIGVLSALLVGEYFGALVSAIANAAASLGASTVAMQTQEPEEAERSEWGRDYYRGLGYSRVDAFVVIVDSYPLAGLQALRAAGKPVVMISHTEPTFACPVVLADNRSGAAEAVRHLLGHGHSRLAFVGDIRSDDIARRYQTYQQAMHEHGIAPDPALFFPARDNLVEAGYECGRQMVATGLPSTAVFAACDNNALGVIEALTEAGYSLPHDQAIVGFDDMAGANRPDLPLSTVSQNFAGMGAEAVRLVALQVAGQEVAAREYTVPTSFVQRESCGCPGVALKVPTPRPTADAVEAFVAEIARDLTTAQSPGAAPVTASAQEMATILRLAVERDLTSLELLKLKQLSASVHAADISDHGVPLVALAYDLAKKVGLDGAPNRMAQCLQQVATGLAQARVARHSEQGKKLNQLMQTDYAISMHLLHGQGRDPRSLDWMAKTAVCTGILALWQDDGEGESLSVACAYDVDDALALSGRAYPATDFPPLELVARVAARPGTLLLVLPMKTDSRDWGYLCLIADISSTLIHHSTYFEWAALLSQALDLEQLATSLEQRNQELAALQEQLVHQALFDSLTGLPNRSLFLDRLSQAIVARRRHPKQHFAVLWLDLDGFKEVNDVFGHPVGDRLLVRVAERLKKDLRGSDTAARFGGDEFAVLLQSVPDVATAVQVADRLQEQLAVPYALEGQQVIVTTSTGIATSWRGYESAEDVLRDADIAMYRAKRTGPNTRMVFDPSMSSHTLRLPKAQDEPLATEQGQLRFSFPLAPGPSPSGPADAEVPGPAEPLLSGSRLGSS